VALLALIPARGGSRGVPRKNVREIAGKPLIAWTIEAALAARWIDRVVVTTDDEEIAAVSRTAGAEIPFLRPAELAADETPGIAPVFHALEALPSYDEVLLLQPTSPLRGASDIEALLMLARETNAPSVVSVTEPDCHPAWMFRLGEGGRLARIGGDETAARRQDLTPVYALNGAMYFARADWLRETGGFIGPNTLGYVMDAERSIDIDTPLDWRIAEFLLGQAQ
jgi:CMP-N,N'-diacetyllegionaminic acid synthase